jgi:hypothetical protein
LRSYERAADVLDSLPLHFLRFYGSTDTDRVLDALEYASYVHDTEHVILDNLQFMMSGAPSAGSGGGSGGRGAGSSSMASSSLFDRFEQQERALDKFRAFATRHDVHLTLVIHPRKEPEDAPLSMSSVFGSAKATQEADTVYIIQRTPDGRKYLDVKKNRFDGAVGIVPLAFDADAKCFFESDGAVVMGAAAKAQPAPARAGGGAPRGGARAFSTSAAATAQPPPPPPPPTPSSSSAWWAAMARRARVRTQLEAEIDEELTNRVLPAAAASGGVLATAAAAAADGSAGSAGDDDATTLSLPLTPPPAA